MAKKRKNQDIPEQESVTEILEEMTAEGSEAPTAEGAADPVTRLKHEIETARMEASNNWDLYLRERADLENARKRHQRDKEDALRFANDRLLKEMVPVLDNLERAVAHAEQGADSNQGLLEGVNMTINQFRKVLEDFGVKPIKAVGAGFDPNLHQAMGQIESAEQAPNTVVTEFQRGYLLHDRLLRPSLVMVAKAPTGANAADSATEEPTP
ncbi:MAG: nucleotide exchange factor GrpE [Desulfuromonadales bacterium]|nr:nucleotide exchange factor GrpE [Desulfuromonadales bacterium]